MDSLPLQLCYSRMLDSGTSGVVKRFYGIGNIETNIYTYYAQYICMHEMCLHVSGENTVLTKIILYFHA